MWGRISQARDGLLIKGVLGACARGFGKGGERVAFECKMWRSIRFVVFDDGDEDSKSSNNSYNNNTKLQKIPTSMSHHHLARPALKPTDRHASRLQHPRNRNIPSYSQSPATSYNTHAEHHMNTIHHSTVRSRSPYNIYIMYAPLARTAYPCQTHDQSLKPAWYSCASLPALAHSPRASRGEHLGTTPARNSRK